MKKTIVALVVLLGVGTGTGFAAPINNLANHQTAVGYVHDSFYLEHKLTNNLTLGLQNDDIYGQYNITNNLRAIVGSRDYNSSSTVYAGVALNASLAPSVDGYVSLVAGSSFKEVQVGANATVAPNVDLNINYRSFMPDYGNDSHRVGLGATLRF